MSVFQHDSSSSEIPSFEEWKAKKEATGKAKPFSEWQNLRRTNPREYYKPSTQTRMMADCNAMGDAWYDQKKEWYEK